LIAQGVSLNVTDGTGQTALHWAAVRGSLPVIETLLRNSADYGIKDIRGYTAIHVASQYGQTAVLYHMVRAPRMIALNRIADVQEVQN
jgi:palmitoyltransferase